MSFDVNNFYFPSLDNNSKSYQTKGQGDEELRVRNICKVRSCENIKIAKGLCPAHYKRKRLKGSVGIKLIRKFGQGYSETPEYISWCKAKHRCQNPNNPRWKDYGGRGIKFCKRWENSFPNFLKDMGKKPSSEYTLERIDNNKGYYPSNCKWDSRLRQSRNKRGVVTLQEATKILSMRNEGFFVKEIANNVGFGTTTISKILNYRHWTSNA